MIRENSAGSDMSKLLSFGYLDNSAQSRAAGTRYQASSAGDQQSAAGSALSSQISSNLPSASSSAA